MKMSLESFTLVEPSNLVNILVTPKGLSMSLCTSVRPTIRPSVRFSALYSKERTVSNLATYLFESEQDIATMLHLVPLITHR